MNDDLSNSLANIDINAVPDTSALETAAKDKTSEDDDLLDTLKDLTLGATASEVTAGAKPNDASGDEPLTPSKYQSSSDELNSDSERSDALVTFAYYNRYKPKTYCAARRIVRTIPRKPRKDKIVPLDEAPSVVNTVAELEFLDSEDWHTLKADALWNKKENIKPSWKELEEGKAPTPTTPLMRPFETMSNRTTVERASPDIVMDVEDFSPLDVRASVYGVPFKVSPSRSPVFRAITVQAEDDVQLGLETAETEIDEKEIAVEFEMTDVGLEDEGEESDSSVEFILDNQSPMKLISTTGNGYMDRRPPPEEQTWRKEYKAKYGTWRGPGRRYASKRNSSDNQRASGSGGGIAGSNYALANASNYTLGDTTAYQFLNTSTEALPQATPNEMAGSPSQETHKGISPRVNKDGTLFFPKTNRGKKHKERESSSVFDDLDPFNKGKGLAKTSAKTLAKAPKPQVVVPPNTASGLPEDEVDYDSTTEEEGSFSIDVNLEDSGARGGATSPAPFISAGLSGIGKAKTVGLEGSSMAPALGHRKEPSWANIVSAPTPVCNSSPRKPLNDPVITEVHKNPIRRLLRENVLRKHREQTAAKTYASAAGTSSSAGTSSPAPTQAQGYVTGDDDAIPTELSAAAIRSIGATIAKKPALPLSTTAGPSRLPLPTKKLTGFAQFTTSAVGLPANSNSDPWADSAPRGTVTIGGFPDDGYALKAKKGKRKTGKATYVAVDETMAQGLPKGNMRRVVPGANYLGESEGREKAGSDDGFTTVTRSNRGGARDARGGRTATRSGTRSVSSQRSAGGESGAGRTNGGRRTATRTATRSASTQRPGIGVTGAGKTGGGRGMGDVRGRGGAKTPRGHGRPLSGAGRSDVKVAGENWKAG